MEEERGPAVRNGSWGPGRHALTGAALLAAAGLLALAAFLPGPSGKAWAFARVLLTCWATWTSLIALSFFAGPPPSPRAKLRALGLGMLLMPAVVGALAGLRLGRSGPQELLGCRVRLELIGACLRGEREARRLQPLEGAAFLTQLTATLRDSDLTAFLCPSDPDAPELNRREALYCSWRGPDLETARKYIDGTLPPETVIACDGCGEAGDEPFHDGLVVLRASGEVEILRPPPRVGPDSPDPLFRHLVR